MKTVTQKFTDNLKRPGIKVIRSVLYKRRYWNGSSYVWEGSWTAINENTVASVSAITAQLDTQQQSEFKTANVTITLKNFSNEWKPGNPAGKFGPDATSPTYGYEPYFMKFQVQAGLIYDDSTQELIPLMTGVLTELNFSSDNGTVEITVSGEQQLLINANAEAVSTTAANESLGTGDGSTTAFFTTHHGVGLISFVKVAGSTLRPGIDYTIGQLNDPLNPAKITFTAAPILGAAITATYIYWLQGQKFETLVAALATQAGIAGGNQQITPVTYPNSIINTHTWQTAADWNGGSSLTLIDTVSIPNSIEYLYSGASTANSTASGWTTAFFSTGTTFTADSSGVLFTAGSVQAGFGNAYQAQTNTVGDFILTVLTPNTNVSTTAVWNFMANGVNTSNKLDGPYYMTQGYLVEMDFAGSGTLGQLRLYRQGSSSGTGGLTLIYASGGLSNPGGTTFTIKVRRRPGGTFSLYLNGTLLGGGTDNTYTTSTYMGYSAEMNQNDVIHFYNAGFALPTSSTNPASWISSTVDFGSTPTSWSPFLSTQTLNSGAVTYYTRTSPDGSTWDSWVAISAGIVGSTLRRYVQTRADIDITNGDPVVASMTIGSLTSSTVITLADFTSLTCHDAIDALAQLANYEYGFDASENFFFRPRITSAVPIMSIGSTDFVQAILSTLTGNDQVFTSVRSSYGAYIAEVDDPGGSPTAPSPRIGYALIEIDGGNLLISADANIAAGVAQAFFNYYSIPRRKYKAATKFLPQLDLSDAISLSFNDNLPPEGWYWGDPDVYWGLPTIYYYNYSSQTVTNLTVKVTAQRIDTEAWTCEYDFEEVI